MSNFREVNNNDILKKWYDCMEVLSLLKTHLLHLEVLGSGTVEA